MFSLLGLLYGLMGLTLGACLGHLITFSRYSMERVAFEKWRAGYVADESVVEVSHFHGEFVLRLDKQDLDGFIDEDIAPKPRSKETDFVKVYVTKKSVQVYAVILLIFLGITLIGLHRLFDVGRMREIEFILTAALLFFAVFGPFMGMTTLQTLLEGQAENSDEPLLEFTPEGLTCHSAICGNVQQILWADIIAFKPILPSFGIRVSVEVKYKRLEDINPIASRYTINVLDLELTECLDLLEFYTGLEADPI